MILGHKMTSHVHRSTYSIYVHLSDVSTGIQIVKDMKIWLTALRKMICFFQDILWKERNVKFHLSISKLDI